MNIVSYLPNISAYSSRKYVRKTNAQIVDKILNLNLRNKGIKTWKEGMMTSLNLLSWRFPGQTEEES